MEKERQEAKKRIGVSLGLDWRQKRSGRGKVRSRSLAFRPVKQSGSAEDLGKKETALNGTGFWD